jgi:hypothetical protein
MAEIVRLQNIAWEAIGTAMVDRTKCNRYWIAWMAHCRLYPKDLGFRPTASETTDRLLTFAVAVREGQYSLGDQIKVQSVKQALRQVAQRLVLDGHPDPRQASPGQHSLDLPIAWLIKKFQDEDPPAQPKLAIPISTITALSKNYDDPAFGSSHGPGDNSVLLPPPSGGIHHATQGQDKEDNRPPGLQH